MIIPYYIYSFIKIWKKGYQQVNYIVLDLEWNQGTNRKYQEKPDLPFEIVEIGAIKLNEACELIDTFHAIVKPTVYLEINSHIEQITHVSIEDLESGINFKQAACSFLDWCGTNYRFCTWGSMDLTELQRNITYFQLKQTLEKPLFYYNIQKLYSICYSDGKSRISLQNAVDTLNIDKVIPFHRADADTYYTALIMQTLNMEKVKKYISVDYYHAPTSHKEEIYLTFDTYSKYVSRTFDTKEEAMADKGVTTTSCYLCRKNIKKKIRWFSYNNHTYYSLMYCNIHGWVKGKIRIKKTDTGKLFAIKTLKITDEEGAQQVYQWQEEVRERRRNKRKGNELNT